MESWEEYKCKNCNKQLVTEEVNYLPKEIYFQVMRWKKQGSNWFADGQWFYCESDWETQKSNYLGKEQYSLIKNYKKQTSDGRWIIGSDKVQERGTKQPGKPTMLLEDHYKCHDCQKIGMLDEFTDKTRPHCSSRHVEVKFGNSYYELGYGIDWGQFAGLHYTCLPCSDCKKIKDINIHHNPTSFSKEKLLEEGKKHDSSEYCLCQREREERAKMNHQKVIYPEY